MTDYSPLELSLPERTGHETVEQRLAALEETVPRLLEALQYTLSNLGAENFNAAALSRLLSPIRARIDGADGGGSRRVQGKSAAGCRFAVHLCAQGRTAPKNGKAK